MAASQSQFSRLPKKQLLRIAEKLIDDGFDSRDPYKDYDDNYHTLERVSSYFSIGVSDEDVQFFAKFIEINDELLSRIFGNDGDKILIEKLIIPVAKTYELQYETWGTCTYEEYMADTFDAYDKSWVMDSARELLNDGNWSEYEGYQRQDTSYENFEQSGFNFTEVKVLEDENKIKESLLGRLVVENTSEVISSLDKKTLLKLKQIIESRLRSL